MCRAESTPEKFALFKVGEMADHKIGFNDALYLCLEITSGAGSAWDMLQAPSGEGPKKGNTIATGTCTKYLFAAIWYCDAEPIGLVLFVHHLLK